MLLNCHTWYSLRYGTISPAQLAKEAAAKGIPALAITDINNVSGVFEFVQACRKEGIKAAAGVEFREGDTLRYIALARNIKGFTEINRHLTAILHGKIKTGTRAPDFSHSFVIYPLGVHDASKLRENEYTGVHPLQLNRLQVMPWREQAERYVALQPVTMLDPGDLHIHVHLRAVAKNTLLSRIEPSSLASPADVLLSPAGMRNRYQAFPQLIENASRLMHACSFDMELSAPKNKQTYTGSNQEDTEVLESLAWDGFAQRYPNKNPFAARRLREELTVIRNLGFTSYFLITWDIVRYSMRQGIYHVGRGSGANSLAAYCLYITDVDPIELNLYFERFINPKRSSPPDFDIDYSWKDRDQVHAYIFDRFGRDHTALLGTINTFRDRSILREMGKVYGLPKEELDSLVDNPVAPGHRNEIVKQIIAVYDKMQDFPNIRSIHAGGVLISEEPIYTYSALDMPPKGLPTTQWDMYTAEEIAFEKLDILSQRGIGHINDCAALVQENSGKAVDVHQVELFKKDKKVMQMLREGETVGCFYIESPAMRGLLTKLRCDDYITLVAASSIIRPGVARSGMMKEYIRRFHHPESFSYLHPVMEEQLRETYGVMVYQEDVLKVCHHFAGLDLGDADVLRRAMSGKPRHRDEFDRITERFFHNCRQRGYSSELTAEVWRQIKSFAGYSFSKAHSASYAVESFQSLYLKAYYPLEFMVAVINNFGGFYRTWVYFNEAKRWGANVCLPCVNNGKYLTSLRGKEIYAGFIHLSGLETALAKRIESVRRREGEYRGLADFIDRTGVTREQLVLLIRCGALRFTGKSKARLLWEAHSLLSAASSTRSLTGNSDTGPGQESQSANHIQPLFPTREKEFILPDLEHSKLEDAYDEIELLSFPVTLDWFDLLQTSFRGEIRAHEMIHHTGKTVRMLGVLVTLKYVKTVKGELMHFGTFFDASGQFFDSVHFPPTLAQYPFRGRGIYLLLGKITEEFGYATLEVQKMAKMPLQGDPRER